jgi:SAM-dependent methyltransferase
MDTNDISKYLRGNILYGDDFSNAELEKWFDDEIEGYSSLILDDYEYPYHESNKMHFFRYLPLNNKYEKVLGMGSAYGDEFLPIANNISSLFILEPSEKLKVNKIGNLDPQYLKPNYKGILPFPDKSIDLITCFGVLHHIPNVNFVLNEMVRILKDTGYILIREPISSMGDWRYKRKGLTKNERGIPVNYFENNFKNNKLTIVKKTFSDSGYYYKLIDFLKLKRTKKVVYVDSIISKLMSWNISYHRKSFFSKLAPGSICYVLKK